MRLDRKNSTLHLLWGIPALALLVGLAVWYSILSYQAGYLLRGGSLPGLVCGIVSGAIIGIEMLLWPRKFFRAWRLIPARHWLAAHLWFGLISLPIAVIHCGLHTGGLLPTLFLVVFALTILSGVFGWFMQHWLPGLILKQVPAETIAGQIPTVSARNAADAYALLASCFGPPPPGLVPRASVVTKLRSQGSPDGVDDDELTVRSSSHKKQAVVVGSVRDVGRVRGRTLRTAALSADVKHAPALWRSYYHVEPYMRGGRAVDPTFASESHASTYFTMLRRECGESCADLVNSLEEYCQQRRQFDYQLKLNAWLHGWLPFHIGLSVATTVLLLVHIFTALRY